MNVQEVSVMAKGIHMPEKIREGKKMSFIVAIDGPAGTGKGTQ